VAIEVRDRGVGIPPEAIKRVFERFFRVPDEATRSRRGTGLGLYVVRTLVRNLGGRVDAHSAGAGQGTTIRLSLPARATAAPADASERG
jgi:signal transduction histidine kinase